MTVSGPWLAWVVVGAVFGFLFFVACVVSVVKAVRDRQRIKARNKVRRSAVTNGQVPAVDDNNCAGCSRRLRPNLIFIHDAEKERRVKGGGGRRKGSFSTTTTFSITSPGSLSSPANLGSGCVEVTTAAEVASQPATISYISSGAVEHDVRVNSQMLSDESCLLERHSPFTGSDEISVDLGTEAITFRRCSTVSSGTVSSSLNGGLISAFPVPFSSLVDSAPFSNHCGNGGAFRVRAHCSGDGTHDRLSPRSPVVVSGRSVYRQCRTRGILSFPACAGTLSSKSSLKCTSCQRQLDSTEMEPRRNSYAADLSSNARIDLPPRRRHSDECRHVISSSLTRLCQNAVRSRRFRRDGADNPAYEALDDEGSM